MSGHTAVGDLYCTYTVSSRLVPGIGQSYAGLHGHGKVSLAWIMKRSMDLVRFADKGNVSVRGPILMQSDHGGVKIATLLIPPLQRPTNGKDGRG